MFSFVYLWLSVLATTTLTMTLSLSSRTSCSDFSNIKITFYGYPDNDPAGPGTAYSCGGRNNVAGGTGTYADPVTFATAPGEYKQCEIIYIPYLKKYGRMEDYCQTCTTDYSSGIKHIDIWTGSATYNGGSGQEDCERALTPDATQSIIRNPAKNYEVVSSPTYNKGSCNTKYTYAGNKASKYC